MTGELLFWISAACLVAACYSAAVSQALQQLSLHELEEYCQARQGKRTFSAIVDFRERMTLAAEFLRIAWTVGGLSSGLFWYCQAQPLALPLAASQWAGLTGSAVLILLLTNGWIPYAAAQLAAVPLVYHSWRFWWLVSFLVLPVTWTGQWLSMVFDRASGHLPGAADEEEWLDDEIRAIVSEGERDGLLEMGEASMIEGVMRLDEKDVCSVMTPRSKLDSLEVNADWDAAVRFVVSSGRTRIPIYDEKIDNIIGVLYAKDLLRESLLAPEKRLPLRKLVRPPMIVPESKMLDEMLRQFLTQHTHLAIIADEYGGVAGIVTIEDILEEIVGEIEDESDDEKPAVITLLDRDRLAAEGGAHIAVINKALQVELPDEDDFDTIAGLIMSRTREIPRAGSQLNFDRVQLKVLRASRRTIDRVEVKVLRDGETPSSSNPLEPTRSES